jgi:hypothetical protein
MQQNIAAFFFASLAAWSMAKAANAAEVQVIRSYAACKTPSTVEKFEEFERRDDDQGYKQLYFQTGASRECIFLRSGELLTKGETQGRWVCVRTSDTSPCYWTAAAAIQDR